MVACIRLKMCVIAIAVAVSPALFELAVRIDAAISTPIGCSIVVDQSSVTPFRLESR